MIKLYNISEKTLKTLKYFPNILFYWTWILWIYTYCLVSACFEKSYKKKIGRSYRNITIRGSFGKPWNMRAYRFIVYIWWNITVQMWHTNYRKKECISLIKYFSVKFIVFDCNSKVLKWCYRNWNSITFKLQFRRIYIFIILLEL